MRKDFAGAAAGCDGGISADCCQDARRERDRGPIAK